jgi:alpha-D-xyloside xylohydrolase
VDRSYVDSCGLLHRELAAVVLGTTSKRWRSPHWYAEGDALRDFLPRAGATGRLRIDVVADHIFRMRYAESEAVPENVTPMCIGAPPPPTRVEIQERDGRIALRTPRAGLEVALAPLELRFHDEGGHRLTEIGGPEKNHFNVWDSYNTGICRMRDDRPLAVECFSLRPGEGVFGFGEKFLALDKVGQTVDLNMVEAMGTTTPRSYKNIPFFWTTGGWGVFLHHSARITCWVGSRAAADLQVAVEDDFLDYYLFVGSPKEILARYTDLTGKSAMPPRWSFGFWQSKISYRSAEEALEVVRKNREHAIPTDVLHLDTH